MSENLVAIGMALLCIVTGWYVCYLSMIRTILECDKALRREQQIVRSLEQERREQNLRIDAMLTKFGAPSGKPPGPSMPCDPVNVKKRAAKAAEERNKRKTPFETMTTE